MSLLAPFGFGQKHSYFHVELTIHELENVPLVTGLFSCKWKIKGAHSLASLQHSAAAAVHQNASQAVASAARKVQAIAHKDVTRTVHATDHESGTSGNLSLGLPHEHAHRQPSGSSSADAASILSHSSNQHNSHAQPHHSHHKDKHSEPAQDDSESLSATPAHSIEPTADEDTRSSNTSPVEAPEANSPISRRDSITSRKTSNSRTKSSFKDLVRHQAAEKHDHNVDPLLFFSQEPKGETEFVKVHDHKVEWERHLQVGMRIGIGKPKTSSPTNSRHESPAVSAKSSAKDLRSRSHRDQYLEDMSTAWGRLTNAELKLTIKQEMPANAKSTTHPSVLGHVVLDLSEFAPNPPVTSSSSRHRQHHHHHHHHHHHYHHHPLHHHHPHHLHHGPGGEHSYRDRTCRSETRKFLLNDSKTNATVKITITMTFLGGAREYYVPPISNGLMVNGLGSIMATSLLEASHEFQTQAQTGSGAVSSHSGSSDSSLRNEPIRASAAMRNRELMGSGLPSASSFSLSHMNSSAYSHHNLYGPPLKSLYAKKTWTNRIPTENLVDAASSSEGAKKKPHRNSEPSFLSARSQGDRAPDDVVNAIFKGIAVGGSHNGLIHDDATAAKAATARASRAERAATVVDSQTRQLGRRASRSPEKTRERIRTVSSASNVSKKSERSFTFSLYSFKDKEKDKDKGRERERAKERKEKEKEKWRGQADAGKSSNVSPDPTNASGRDKTQKSLLSVPGSDKGNLTPGSLVETPAASTDALPRTNSESAITAPSSATAGSAKRLSSVRWNLADDDAAGSDAASSQATTPVGERFNDQEARDRAAMPPPPSVVVDHAFIPIRAGGITAASSSALNLTETVPADTDSRAVVEADSQSKPADDALLSPLPTFSSHPASAEDADVASVRSFSSSTSAYGNGKKPSSSDLNRLYQAVPSMPQSLSGSTAVGLERLKRTSRAIGQFAKDAARSTRSSARPGSSSGAHLAPNSQGVTGRERNSKGNRGIEPSEAASKGWQGAGWLRPISTAPAPLPPCSPDLSSSSEDEDEDEFEEVNGADAGVDRFGSRNSNNSEDGRRSSATDQTAVSDTPDTPRISVSEAFRPPHKREASFESVYHDVDDDVGWADAEGQIKLPESSLTTAELGVHSQHV